MTPEQLKASILQYAIQGKLVEQRPEEGTGEELYRQIQAEKQRLIKEGKIKKEKALPEISEDEFPFEIPESWKWVRLSTIGITQTGNTPSKSHPEYIGIDIPFITPGDILNGQICYNNQALSLLGKNVARVCDEDSIMQVCIGGSIGKVAITDRKVAFNQQINVVSPLFCLSKYLFAVMQSVYFTTSMKERAGGTATPIINRGLWDSLCIPLPPLAEQKRIVAKIEELLPYIDRYAASYERLEQVNTEFPEDMKKSVLQYAIQGKLVEQRPEEGTGEELYQQIQTEKQRLIKEGKIKKEKPLPEIAEDEKPYDIPDNWTWVRFGDLGSYKKGPFGSAITKSMFVPKGNGAIKVYEQKNAIQKDATLGDYYIRRDYFESKMKGFEVFPGDIIVSCAGTIGETYVMPDKFEQGIINQALMRMKIFEPLYIPYFLTFFDFVLKKNARSGSKGSAIKNIPPFEILKNYLVPIPPLAEQKRIVAKLEEILPLCERLK
jgi:type I restriction enzyme S subunit